MALYKTILLMNKIKEETKADVVEIWAVKIGETNTLVFYIRREITSTIFKKNMTEEFLKWKDSKDETIIDNIIKEFKEKEKQHINNKMDYKLK